MAGLPYPATSRPRTRVLGARIPQARRAG